MKYYELDKEEQKILDEVERGEWIPVKDQAKARREAIAAAKNTLKKTKNINIRLSERDLYKLKARAIKEGLPYQTLVSSILHRFTNE